HFIISTDIDGAEDFKLVSAPAGTPGRDRWSDLVPYERGRMIVSFEVYKHYLVWLERRNALPRIVVRRLSDHSEDIIAFDEPAYSLSLIGANDFDSEVIRFSYASPVHPEQTFDYDMARRQRTLLKEQKVPSGHDPLAYEVLRLAA